MIYIYKKFSTSEQYSGIGYVVDLFARTFPDAEIISQPAALAELEQDDVLIFPRIFISVNNALDAEAYYLMQTKAKVVQSLFWDLEAIPACVAQSIGRADLIHAPSRFVAKLFRPHPNIKVFPIPVAEFPKRTKIPQWRVIGSVIASVHGRKNLHGFVELAQRLRHWDFRLVITPLWRKNDEQRAVVERLASLPNVLLLSDLRDTELCEFYHSLTWFVVLSGGEAYYLPGREALKCGVPLIAPDNSSFSELRGEPGVFLVETELAACDDTQDTVGLPLRFPQINKVVDLIENTTPPQPVEINPSAAVLPSFSDWKMFWRNALSDLVERKRAWHFSEPSALFALHNINFMLGINDVSVRWARRVGALTFCIYDELPIGVRAPIIVPFAQGFSDWMNNAIAPPILVYLSLLRARNPDAPIILWVHNRLYEQHHSILLPFVDLFCGSSLAMMVYNRMLGAYLPNPIGNPPAPDSKNEGYFIAWGMNFTALQWFVTFLRYFPYPVYLCFTFTTDIPHDALRLLRNIVKLYERSPKIKILVTLPLEESELDELIDNAAGYLCFDFYYSPIPTGETSARIPYVLRKGKPILANDSARNIDWGAYVRLVKFTERLIRADEQAVMEFARSLIGNLEAHVPQNVPTIEQEIEQFNSVIAQAKLAHARRNGKPTNRA